MALMLSACGGGGAADDKKAPPATDQAITSISPEATAQQVIALPAVPEKAETVQEAARFLTQATFGPTTADVNQLMATTYSAWLQAQFSKPLPAVSHLNHWDTRDRAWKTLSPQFAASYGDVLSSFWTKAITGDDQLRQRVAFALSEIFVVSFADNCGDQNSRGMADFMDMLGRQAFGSYRQLLEKVALHPVMGCYLSHIHNQQADATKGRVPDENFAREVMQLFSIGLYQLNPDGSQKLNGSTPIETYGPSDVADLAKVFTGFSWDCPLPDDNGCFDRGASYDGGMQSNPDRWILPMQAYPRHHAKSKKTLFGVTLPAQSTPAPAASLKFALDLIADHPNVGPFIGRQLIQRLVTSNPSPGYISRVALAFNTSKGSLRATVQAVLMDPEARDTATALSSNTFGKVREPVLRLSALLRAYGARSATGAFLITETKDSSVGINQAPLFSPSVFNFFRPGYTPPGSFTADANQVAPEMQLLNETSVAGYTNFMREAITRGVGLSGYYGTGYNGSTLPDVRLDYLDNPSSPVRVLSDNAESLVQDINTKLFYGTMSDSLRQELVPLVASIRYGEAVTTQNYRIWIALLLAVASPEFLVQR